MARLSTYIHITLRLPRGDRYDEPVTRRDDNAPPDAFQREPFCGPENPKLPGRGIELCEVVANATATRSIQAEHRIKAATKPAQVIALRDHDLKVATVQERVRLIGVLRGIDTPEVRERLTQIVATTPRNQREILTIKLRNDGLDDVLELCEGARELGEA